VCVCVCVCVCVFVCVSVEVYLCVSLASCNVYSVPLSCMGHVPLMLSLFALPLHLSVFLFAFTSDTVHVRRCTQSNAYLEHVRRVCVCGIIQKQMLCFYSQF
jgi:hypothetical protein